MPIQTHVVDVFATPYERWSTRDTTPEEALSLMKSQGLSVLDAMHVRETLLETVSTHREAASYILRHRADNALESHINAALASSAEFAALRAMLPALSAPALAYYQSHYSEGTLEAADCAVRADGVHLAPGQLLFHGGYWACPTPSFTTTRVFSTTFCPQVALRNAEWKGKAYDAGRLDLMLLRVAQPAVMAYVYGRDGEHGHEKEVLLASGVTLYRRTQTHVCDVSVTKAGYAGRTHTRLVPAYVIEVDVC